MSEIEQEREDRLAERGPQFLIRLAAMLRTARTHDVSNQAFQRQLKDFIQLLSAMFEEDSPRLSATSTSMRSASAPKPRSSPCTTG